MVIPFESKANNTGHPPMAAMYDGAV